MAGRAGLRTGPELAGLGAVHRRGAQPVAPDPRTGSEAAADVPAARATAVRHAGETRECNLERCEASGHEDREGRRPGLRHAGGRRTRRVAEGRVARPARRDAREGQGTLRTAAREPTVKANAARVAGIALLVGMACVAWA